MYLNKISIIKLCKQKSLQFLLESVSVVNRADVVRQLVPHLGSGDSEGLLAHRTAVWYEARILCCRWLPTTELDVGLGLLVSAVRIDHRLPLTVERIRCIIFFSR